MAVLTVQECTRAAAFKPTYAAAAAAGDSFDNTNGNTILKVKNGGATVTVSVAVQSLSDGRTAQARTYSIDNDAAGYDLGPFPIADYNDANNRVVVTYSDHTNLTVAAVHYS